MDSSKQPDGERHDNNELIDSLVSDLVSDGFPIQSVLLENPLSGTFKIDINARYGRKVAISNSLLSSGHIQRFTAEIKLWFDHWLNDSSSLKDLVPNTWIVWDRSGGASDRPDPRPIFGFSKLNPSRLQSGSDLVH